MLTRIRRSDEGYVLVVVLLSMVLVMALITGVMTYAVGSRDLSARDQDWNAALAAAEAGIDDYLFRLNQDGSYWQYSSSNAPPDGNQAFATWVQVPGGSSDAFFRYTPDTSSLAVNGTVKITATGKVGKVTRSIDASVRRRNFLDYLYFTDFETTDPANSNVYTGSGGAYTTTQAQTYCSLYYYSGRDISGRTDFAGDADPPNCNDITFISQDTINGPLHTNDAIRISGSPTFNGDTSTTYNPATGNRYVGSGTPVFATAGDPRYADPLTMPPSNADIRNETSSTLTDPGCLFTGPTAIRMNNDGTIDVISPFTQSFHCSWSATPATSMYQRFTVTRFTLPTDGARNVIYVQNVPTSGENATTGCPAWATRPAIGGNAGSGTTPNRTHPLGFPQKNDTTPLVTGTSPTGYGCRNGDAFVQGTLKGRLTIATENNVVLFGGTSYNSSTDLLGLVANNYIGVYHPVSNPSSPIDGTNEVQTITLTGWGSGDRFRLAFNGSTTTNIGNPTSAGAVQAALENLSTMDPGDVAVTGAASGPFTVTFGGQYVNTDVPQITVASQVGVTVTVATTQAGGGSTASCDGAASSGNNYCNLKVPGLLTSSTTPSLFNGSTPGTSTMSTATGQYANRGPSISAALVTVAHSFTVQNYNLGIPFSTYSAAASLLTVTGAIAQKYRGAVGTFSGGSLSSGYAKSYNYDQRLKYDSPPKFLDPVASAWQVVTWAERPAAYQA